MHTAVLAKTASYDLQSASLAARNKCLQEIYAKLRDNQESILEANSMDCIAAASSKDTPTALMDRLSIGGKFTAILEGIQQVIGMPDPLNRVDLARQLDTGLDLYRVSCPIGVLLVIFEARPEVVVQITALALKTGNAVILKGGKEAAHTNSILHDLIQSAIKESETLVSPDVVQLVTTREAISTLLKCDKHIDLCIPRGSNELVTYIKSNTTIPVLGHSDGICTVFVDKSADIQKAIAVIIDGKCEYPAACNSTEKVLIHVDTSGSSIVAIIDALLQKNVVIYAAKECFDLVASTHVEAIKQHRISLAAESHYDTEFISLKISIMLIDSVKSAISHINQRGSHHTDCIVTESEESANLFMQNVDSAGVYHNASTRFADGFRYGFGAEVGVSTNKIHARGPVGLEGLTSYKYRLYGDGHIVAAYNRDKKPYDRREIAFRDAQIRVDQ